MSNNLMLNKLISNYYYQGAIRMINVWQKSMWWKIFQSPNAFNIQAWEHPPSGNPIAKQIFPTSDLLVIETYSKTKTRIILYLAGRRKFDPILCRGEIKSCYINSPHVEDWNSKFCVQYGNVSPSPRRKRDWVKFPICHSWQSHSWLIGNFIFHHLWLRHYVVKNPIPFPPR